MGTGLPPSSTGRLSKGSNIAEPHPGSPAVTSVTKALAMPVRDNENTSMPHPSVLVMVMSSPVSSARPQDRSVELRSAADSGPAAARILLVADGNEGGHGCAQTHDRPCSDRPAV